jgi:hypothetical protein
MKSIIFRIIPIDHFDGGSLSRVQVESKTRNSNYFQIATRAQGLGKGIFTPARRIDDPEGEARKLILS